jgi:hypothetical protein
VHTTHTATATVTARVVLGSGAGAGAGAGAYLLDTTATLQLGTQAARRYGGRRPDACAELSTRDSAVESDQRHRAPSTSSITPDTASCE